MALSDHVTHFPLDALTPHPSNARTHSRKQIRQIASSIEAFGFTSPVLVDGDGRILAGHGRVEAARLLGLAVVPTIRIDHLSEAEKRAYIIADNKLAENAGWDLEILTSELEIINEIEIGFDLTLTGFETPELDMLIGGSGDDEDDVIENLLQVNPAAPALSRVGDLWQLGDHRLLCGDARAPDALTRLMDGTQAQMVFTDPPYNVRIDRNVCGSGAIRHREFVMASGEMSQAQYRTFLKTTLSNLANHSCDGSMHFVCIDWRHVEDLLAIGGDVYDELKNLCVWVKDNGGMGSLYRSRHELIVVFKKGRDAHINNVELGRHGRNRSNVWFYPGVNALHKDGAAELAMHPTVKPVGLVADTMRDCSHRGGVVLDTFSGSGTTIIAAEKTGRKAYGLELDPIYVDTAVRRWQRLTGQRAVHADSGQTFDDLEMQRGHLPEEREASGLVREAGGNATRNAQSGGNGDD